MDWFDQLSEQVFDLAAVASGAGFAGSGLATLVAIWFSGKILKFLIKLVFTAVFTGIAFYFLLGWLGFEIVAKEPVDYGALPEAGAFALDESGLAGAPPEDAGMRETGDDRRQISVRSPFRRED